METTTEASPTNRELTATEIKIAIAQIEDRLMRLANAQSELTEFCGDGSGIQYNRMMKDVADNVWNDSHDEIVSERCNALRAKYEIPDGVHLFYEGEESALMQKYAKKYKPHLLAWVKGKLTLDQCDDMYFFFEEIEQADWGWIMLERPLGYYNATCDDDPEAIRLEMVSIGTRSRYKNAKLLPLTDGAFFK